jgi:hypothetical protein
MQWSDSIMVFIIRIEGHGWLKKELQPGHGHRRSIVPGVIFYGRCNVQSSSAFVVGLLIRYAKLDSLADALFDATPTILLG